MEMRKEISEIFKREFPQSKNLKGNMKEGISQLRMERS
jgi:hypothetical protein